MPSHTRRIAPFALGLSLLALLIGVVAAIAGQADDPVAIENPSSRLTSPLEGPFQVRGEGVERIAILGRPTDDRPAPAPADAAPGSQSALALSLAGQGVDQPVPAHAVSRGLGEQVTVAEVGDDACVGIDSLATCGSPQEVLDGHVVAVELCSPDLAAGSYRVLGMAPDGVEAVRIEMRAGSPVAAPVLDNTFEVVVSDLPLALTWQRAGSEGLRVPAPVPPAYDPSSCKD